MCDKISYGKVEEDLTYGISMQLSYSMVPQVQVSNSEGTGQGLSRAEDTSFGGVEGGRYSGDEYL